MVYTEHSFETVIFDLDGVITKTALVHAAAWKEMFDEYLSERSQSGREKFREFTHEYDYLPYVDGKPRYKGVQSFLESRRIQIPYGDPTDLSTQETVCGLGNKKNEKFLQVLEDKGVEIYEPAVKLVKDLRDKGIHVGVASSSKNCQHILQKAGIEDLFETRVDGVVSARIGLQGKPEPDIFVKAARNLGSAPDKTVVVEDAVSGVQAGAKGKFGLVVGVAREDNEQELKKNGADVVVLNFEGVDTNKMEEWFNQKNQ